MENKPVNTGEDDNKPKETQLPSALYASLEVLGIKAVEESEEDDDTAVDTNKRKKRRVRDYLRQLLDGLLSKEPADKALTQPEGATKNETLPLIKVEPSQSDINPEPEDRPAEESTASTDSYRHTTDEVLAGATSQKTIENLSDPDEPALFQPVDAQNPDMHKTHDELHQDMNQFENINKLQLPTHEAESQTTQPSRLGLEAAERLSQNPNQKLRRQAKKMRQQINKLEREENKLKEVQKKQQRQIEELRAKRSLAVEMPQPEAQIQPKGPLPQRYGLPPENMPKTSLDILDEADSASQIEHTRAHQSEQLPHNPEIPPKQEAVTTTNPENVPKTVERITERREPVERNYEQRHESKDDKHASHVMAQTASAESGGGGQPITPSLSIAPRLSETPPPNIVPTSPGATSQTQTMYKQAVKTGALGGVIFIAVFLALIALGVI